MVFRAQGPSWIQVIDATGAIVLKKELVAGETASAVGALPLANVGERLELTGEFSSHPKYGSQFKAVAYHTVAPATLSAIETYLGSGLIKGVGPATARARKRSSSG